MTIRQKREAKINYLKLRTAELELLVKKFVAVYPIEEMPDDFHHKSIKHSLINLKLLEDPTPPEPEHSCFKCGIEIPAYMANSSKAKCAKCYMEWKKAKRGGR